MTSTLKEKWEFLPDDKKNVDVERIRLPNGWLVKASGLGGKPRSDAFIHYHDKEHEWKPCEVAGVVGPRRFFEWQLLRNFPAALSARLSVPDGWLVFLDSEVEGSTPQLVFCPDEKHEWQL